MNVAVIDRLVTLHGEDGAVPTRPEWSAILAMPEAPIFILNLLAFAPNGGAQAYQHYIQGVGPAFERAGGEQVFYGPAALTFGMNADGAWDAAILTRYPSPGALAQMWLDPDFVQAHKSREDGLTRSQVVVIDAAKAQAPNPKGNL